MARIDDALYEVRPGAWRVQSVQLSLFSRTAEQVIAAHGIARIDVERLHDKGLLSFPPATNRPLGPAEEAELVFLCTLMQRGCDLAMLRAMLAELPAPYAYDLDHMVYDFAAGRWLTLRPADAGAAVAFAIAKASSDEDDDALAALGHGAVEALLVRAREP